MAVSRMSRDYAIYTERTGERIGERDGVHFLKYKFISSSNINSQFMNLRVYVGLYVR